jgi:hypothetical protein
MKTTEQDLSGWEGRRYATIPKAGPEARPRRTCPLHTPAVTASVPGGGYETECLVCGARGPKRETTVEAKLAFDAVLGL